VPLEEHFQNHARTVSACCSRNEDGMVSIGVCRSSKRPRRGEHVPHSEAKRSKRTDVPDASEGKAASSSTSASASSREEVRGCVNERQGGTWTGI
jgi:hypothetical protein